MLVMPLILVVLMVLVLVLVLLLLMMMLLSSGCAGIVRHDGLRVHKRILLLLLLVTLLVMLMMLRRRRLGPASPVRRVWWLSGEGQFAGIGARWVDRARSGRSAVLL